MLGHPLWVAVLWREVGEKERGNSGKSWRGVLPGGEAGPLLAGTIEKLCVNFAMYDQHTARNLKGTEYIPLENPKVLKACPPLLDAISNKWKDHVNDVR